MNIGIGDAWAYGFNCGLMGPNEINCHFSLFATPELTAAWERGKRSGEASRANEIAKPATTRRDKGEKK